MIISAILISSSRISTSSSSSSKAGSRISSGQNIVSRTMTSPSVRSVAGYSRPRIATLARPTMPFSVEGPRAGSVRLDPCLLRGQVVRLAVVDRVDLLAPHELDHIHRSGGSAAERRLQFVVGEHDVAALVDLVTLDDLRRRDFVAVGLGHLAIADAAAIALAELVELGALLLGGGVQADRDGHEAKRDGALPDGAGHGVLRGRCGARIIRAGSLRCGGWASVTPHPGGSDPCRIEPRPLGSRSRMRHRLDRRTVVVLLTAVVLLIVFEYWGLAGSFRASIVARAGRRLAGGGVPAVLRPACPYQYWGVASLVIRVLIPFGVVAWVLREPLREWGWRIKPRWRDVRPYVLFLAAMIPIVVVMSLMASFQAKYPFYEGAVAGGWHFWGFQLFYGLQFLGVEAFFRGFLLFGLERRFGWYAIGDLDHPLRDDPLRQADARRPLRRSSPVCCWDGWRCGPGRSCGGWRSTGRWRSPWTSSC